jgi:WD40 repeat protein/uncharacterized caspase-like protein
MKEEVKSWQKAFAIHSVLCGRLSTILLLASAGAISAFAQTPSPTPTPSKQERGIGLEKSAATNSTTTEQQQREARPELIIQTGYNNFFGATRLVFSPDGRLLATTTFRSSTVKLWETATGRELRNLSSGTQSALSISPVVAFSRDSRLVAAGTGDNAVKVWEVTTGREVRTLSGSQGSLLSAIGVYFIAFSADGRTLVTASDAIRVWDLSTGNVLRELSTGSANTSSMTGGEGLALSPDGGQLARAVSDGSGPRIVVSDLTTGRETRSVKLPDQEIDNIELSFTIDGRLLAAGIQEKKLKVWDATAKLSARELGPTLQDYSLVKFSHDGRLLALSEGYTVKLWEAATGRVLPTLNVPNAGIFLQQNGVFVGFSDDGRTIATSGFGAQTALWETETGKQLLQMKGRSNMAYEVAFSADGNQLFSGGRTHWDLRTGRGLRVTAAPSDKFFSLPSMDGKLLAQFAPNNATVTIIETATGRQLQTLTPAAAEGAAVQRATFSPDGKLLVTSYMQTENAQDNSANSDAMKAAMKAGRKDPAAAMKVYNEEMNRRNATRIDNQIKIWEVASGRELRTVVLGQAPTKVGFSADGRVLATLVAQGQITLWDVQSGSRLRDLSPSPTANSPFGNLGSLGNLGKPGSAGSLANMPDMTAMMTNVLGAMSAGTMLNVTSLAFSSDGQTLATGGLESKSNFDQAALMNAGRVQKKNSKQPFDPQDFMKNIKVEAVGQVVLWDVASGREIGKLKGHGKGVSQVAFSHDGRLLASSSTDNTIKIWDVAGRRELATLVGHTASINSMDFSPDGRLLASASDDGGTFLWDTNTGEHLLTLISLDDGGEWMVVSPEGLFDGSPVSWNQILWRYNQDTFNVAPIEWFFNEFYYPGLLADIFAGKRPHVAQDVGKKDRRQPTVKVTVGGEPAPSSAVTTRTVKVKIDVTDAGADKDHPQGSGARDMRLFRNGSLIKVWHGDVLQGKPAATFEEEITVVAGQNRLTAYAFNRDNVKSKDAMVLLTGADSLKRSGAAYVIAVGVNEYSNAQYNLKYAVADARSFADELRLRQTQLSTFERVEIISLLNEDATKANILSVLQRLAGGSAVGPPTLKAGPFDGLRRAEPEDAVIVYFAGHGTAQGQRFYLIPHDLGYSGDRTKLNKEGLQTILDHSISDVELEQAVEGLDAGHLLFVIDACNSGQALEAEEKRRGPMNSKGLAQLAYEKGMYILTAAQSYQAALEAARLGHGLLTYALVEEGLKTAIADNEPKDGVVSAREWLDFATERVPQMQEEKMKQGRGLGLEIAFTEGEQNIPDPAKRSVQRPRVFYRRELEANQLVIAKP